jgi:glycosyltransferase involved in cell wall biosynthesis
MSTFLNSCIGNNISKLVALSDSIICVSKMQKEIIEKEMPSITNKLSVIYNPFPNVDQFSGRIGDFGYFGGSTVLKGFFFLLRALHKVRTRYKIHATNMLDFSKCLRTRLQRQFGIIIHQRLERELFERLYQRIQVVIVPSLWPEPLPYVVSEALLSKRLVIASRIGGIPELAKDCKGVFLFNPGNSEQLVELIEYVAGLDSETRLNLGAENRESFLKNFNNNKTYREFIKVLTQS